MHSDALVFHYNNGKIIGLFKISEAKGPEAQEAKALHGIKVCLKYLYVHHSPRLYILRIPLF